MKIQRHQGKKKKLNDVSGSSKAKKKRGRKKLVKSSPNTISSTGVISSSSSNKSSAINTSSKSSKGSKNSSGSLIGEKKINQIKLNEMPLDLRKDIYVDYRKVAEGQNLYSFDKTTITVNKILKMFLKHYKKNNKKEKEKLERMEYVLAGFEVYFNAVLYKALLFKIEKPQHDKFMANKKKKPKPSMIYGYYHFLRFFVKLPKILEENIQPLTVEYLYNSMNEIYDYLLEDRSKFILE